MSILPECLNSGDADLVASPVGCWKSLSAKVRGLDIFIHYIIYGVLPVVICKC